MDDHNTASDLRRVLADTIAELGRVKRQRDELAAALTAVIAWWEDDHDFPYQGAKVDPGEACQWYKRRLMMIANCARAALAELEVMP